jgi:DNA-binding transcriptional LysR family regulator
LTPAAQELVRRADDILAILERAESELASSDNAVRGTLRLAAFSTVSRAVVPQVITALQRRYPELDVRYQQAEPETGLLQLSSRLIDVLVADSYPGTSQVLPSEMHAERLLRDPIRAYLPAAAEVGGLHQVPWVFYPRGTEAHAWARTVCHRAGFEPDVRYESADLLFHQRMVETGLAAAFLPDLLDGGKNWGAVSSELIDTQNFRDISFICRARAERQPSIAACRAAFTDHLRGLGRSDADDPM